MLTEIAWLSIPAMLAWLSDCRFKLGFLHWGCTLVLHWGYSLALKFWTCKRPKGRSCRSNFNSNSSKRATVCCPNCTQQEALPTRVARYESAAGGGGLGGTPCKDQELTVDQEDNSCNPFKPKFILSACKNFRFSQSDRAIFLTCMAKCIIHHIHPRIPTYMWQYHLQDTYGLVPGAPGGFFGASAMAWKLFEINGENCLRLMCNVLWWSGV